MEALPLVYMARHGRTSLNKSGCFRGPIDAPLDSSGWNDAHTLAKYFEGVDLSHIYHSDKIRATSTAKTIADRKHMTATPNSNLQAWNVGDLGGEPKNPANLQLIEYHVQNPDEPLPGGESLNEFKSRVQPMLDDAIEMAIDSGCPVLLVAHSSVIHEAGTVLHDDHDAALVEPGGVACIFIKDGQLCAAPVYRPKLDHSLRAEAIT